MKQRQEILHVSEHAVVRLVEGRLCLEETVPGLDLDCDVQARMAFAPLIADGRRIMPEACFLP